MVNAFLALNLLDELWLSTLCAKRFVTAFFPLALKYCDILAVYCSVWHSCVFQCS